MTTIDGNDGEEGGSIVRRALTTAHSDKRQERPSTYHLKRLLDEACPNHTHPIRHKLKDCGMMRSFMTSRSLTSVAEIDEEPDGRDTTPFPEENVVMTVYGGHPSLGRCRMSNLSPKALTRCS
jgi:hypothetical protein